MTQWRSLSSSSLERLTVAVERSGRMNIFKDIGFAEHPGRFWYRTGFPYCCVINIKALILAWLDEVIQARKSSSGLFNAKIDTHRGWTGYIRSCSTERMDSFREHLWNACAASIKRVK